MAAVAHPRRRVATATRSLPGRRSRRWDTLAREAAGAPTRRTGRFVQLALIGAGRCVEHAQLPPDTATYFTSGRGDLEVTLDAARADVRAWPLAGAVRLHQHGGSSACFHVAQSFRPAGPQPVRDPPPRPLESALRLAALDMAAGGVTNRRSSARPTSAPRHSQLTAHASASHADTGGRSAATGSCWRPAPGSGVPWSGRLMRERSLLLRRRGRCASSGLRSTPTPDLGPRSLAGDSISDAERLERFPRGLRGLRKACGPTVSGLPWYDSQAGQRRSVGLLPDVAGSARTPVHVERTAGALRHLVMVRRPRARAPRAGGPRRRLSRSAQRRDDVREQRWHPWARGPCTSWPARRGELAATCRRRRSSPPEALSQRGRNRAARPDSRRNAPHS